MSKRKLRPMTASMIEALENLEKVWPKCTHGAYALPRRTGHQRLTPLRALKDRGYVALIRKPNVWSTSKDVEWAITDEGRIALALERGNP